MNGNIHIYIRKNERRMLSFHFISKLGTWEPLTTITNISPGARVNLFIIVITVLRAIHTFALYYYLFLLYLLKTRLNDATK